MSQSYPSHLHAIIDVAEKKHFWFRARQELIISLMKRYINNPRSDRFCEIGFGTGELLAHIENAGFQTTGIDINAEALRIARGKIRGKLYKKSLSTYIPKKKFDAIGLFDVLEHQKDDLLFLRHCASIVKTHGLFFINVPAGNWLWSDLDVTSGHIRRYTKERLRQKLEDAGFEIMYLHYWNFFLLPLMYLRTFTSSSTLTPYVTTPPHYINELLYGILRIENILFSKFPVYIGASIITVARKV